MKEIEIFEIDSEDSDLTSFYVQGEKCIQVGCNVVVHYLNNKTLKGTVTQSESRYGVNAVRVRFFKFKAPPCFIEYDLIG